MTEIDHGVLSLANKATNGGHYIRGPKDDMMKVRMNCEFHGDLSGQFL